MTQISDLMGQRVRVHKNLHRGDWSVTVRGRVVAHVAEIVLSDVSFKVRESARQQVIARRCRQVHAWGEGTVVASAPDEARVAITYNPYRAATFTRRDEGSAVSHCAAVHFTAGDGAVAVGEVS